MSLFDGYIVNQEIKTVMKIYPDFVRLFEYEKPFLVRRYDYELSRYKSDTKRKYESDPEELEAKSLAQAKVRLEDTVLCNGFDLFTTFTFAKDRQDVDKAKRRMAFWLNNQRILHGKFLYLVVPEFHKDKKSLHFHGLFAGYKGNLVDSGHLSKRGQTVYNIASYRAGFTTAVVINPSIEDKEKVSGYVTKYITKDMPTFKNKHRYWPSRGLKRPLKIVNPLLNNHDRALFEQVYQGKKRIMSEFRGQLPDADIARIADYGRRRVDDLVVSEW